MRQQSYSTIEKGTAVDIMAHIIKVLLNWLYNFRTELIIFVIKCCNLFMVCKH